MIACAFRVQVVWLQGSGFMALGFGSAPLSNSVAGTIPALPQGSGSGVFEFRISSRRVFAERTRVQRKLLHTWIISVIVQQYLVQIGRKMDVPSICH